MCGPAMAAAIAAADNVTNVRCPGLPVAGVTGYGLATGSLRVTYVRSSCLYFIVKLRSLGKPSGIQAAGQAEVAVMSSQILAENRLPRISVQRFVKCLDEN